MYQLNLRMGWWGSYASRMGTAMFGDLQKKLNPDGEKEKEEGKERKKRGAANKQAIKSKKSN